MTEWVKAGESRTEAAGFPDTAISAIGLFRAAQTSPFDDGVGVWNRSGQVLPGFVGQSAALIHSLERGRA